MFEVESASIALKIYYDEIKEVLDEHKTVIDTEQAKTEHITERQFTQLTETYVPYRDSNGAIVGIIELYQPLASLTSQIVHELRTTLIICAAIFILFLLLMRMRSQ